MWKNHGKTMVSWGKWSTHAGVINHVCFWYVYRRVTSFQFNCWLKSVTNFLLSIFWLCYFLSIFDVVYNVTSVPIVGLGLSGKLAFKQISDLWFGTWFLWLSIYWEFHHPNWRTHIFQRANQINIELNQRKWLGDWNLFIVGILTTNSSD